MEKKPQIFNVDKLISRLLSAKNHRPGKQVDLSKSDILSLLGQTKLVLMSQPMLLELDAPVTICGDIHGQYYDLLQLFDAGGDPANTGYLFLGDYVDRGRNSLEVVCLLLAYKVRYPDGVFLLRGNHELPEINFMYGFREECRKRFKGTDGISIWRSFNDVFKWLPLAAIVGDRIFCCHGGLSPELHSPDQIRRIARPLEIPDEGLVSDLMWADPHPEPTASGWHHNDARGTSFLFGIDVVEKFLEANDLDLVCRAHDVQQNGYGFSGKSQKLVTVFSAPNYAGTYDNSGAIMTVSEDLECGFKILRPVNRKVKYRYDSGMLRPSSPSNGKLTQRNNNTEELNPKPKGQLDGARATCPASNPEELHQERQLRGHQRSNTICQGDLSFWDKHLKAVDINCADDGDDDNDGDDEDEDDDNDDDDDTPANV
ncbi:serine/threonine-protein phosphatase [Elysia marginata]|uniref:Serine/threonine-protein phosphatase n=1 Tax=Elysia marginata TaxID=1093978 RepID=A0AAV4GGN6_9GAST|nr:serine/threonine-protein phosphatase [Elysia marginata]